jgi:hypothetical protein
MARRIWFSLTQARDTRLTRHRQPTVLKLTRTIESVVTRGPSEQAAAPTGTHFIQKKKKPGGGGDRRGAGGLVI